MANISGIDLGTTYSALAMLNAIGKPQIVSNADGDRLTPSAIYFDEENSDTIRVGVEAVNSRHVNPDRSVRWIKRHMGDPDYRKVIDDRAWTPVELSAMILAKLKQDGESEHGPIEDVVISVPAHFDEVRRRATMDAGAMIGLNVVGIVNEPVAGALYYATSHRVCDQVLVYDLGGGTFDVTILSVDGHQMDIACSQGDHALGGMDFDRAILNILQDKYRERFKKELITCGEDQATYEDEAEDIKRTLSRRKVAKKMLYGPAGSMKVEIGREEFVDAISDQLVRTDILVELALEQANCKPSDITDVLLVGGSTRIPAIRTRLERLFGFPPKAAVNVDESVALGAALYAGLQLLRESPGRVPAGIAQGLKDIKLTDVCNQSYGTICSPVDKETGQRTIENRILLAKNTPLPCEASQTFYTMKQGQTLLEVTVTQGEDVDPAYVNKIATYQFELPPNRPPHQPVQVTYSYDVNQRMHCRFEDVHSGKVLDVKFEVGQGGHLAQASAPAEPTDLESVQVELSA
ncbi:MAG: Hsp70 family protein [Planctomycetes bacterium]|nr:Hsp70 family protein [Planctomycetota bacterium]